MDNDPLPELTPPPWFRSVPRILLRVAVIGALVWCGLQFYEWVSVQLLSMTGIGGNQLMVGVLAVVLVGYAVLIAIPFMPGVEIGAALLLMEGARIAPFVYLATLLGLLLAFAVGRWVSLDWLHNVFRDMRMLRACQLVHRIKTQPAADRLSALTRQLPAVLAQPLVTWRYVTIAVLLNLPGSVVIGGGGGILMLAGVSRLFRPGLILLTLAIGVLPVPLAVWLWGTELLR